MTNEVERLILDKKGNKEERIDYSKQVAYKFYNIIWKYILSNERYGYIYLNINFKVEEYDGKYYIMKSDGVNYSLVADGYKFNNLTYFHGCEHIYCDNVLNTNIDLKRLFDLLESDEIDYSLSKDNTNNKLCVNIVINKEVVEKIVNGVLVKNRVLSKNK